MSNRWRVWVVSCALCASLLTAFPAVAAAISKVAIILEEEHSKQDDARVLNAVTGAFINSQRFDVVERSRIEAVLKEQDFQSFIGDEAQRVGRLIGVDYLALVDYERREREGVALYTFRARVISVATGQVRATVDSQPSLIDRIGAPSVEDAANRFLDSIKKQFPVEGYVIKIDGPEVVVDLGKTDGIQKGDGLQVLRMGEDIVHPVTGETIPGEERVVGGLKVLTVTDTTSLCKMRKGKGGVELGDKVRFHGGGPWPF